MTKLTIREQTINYFKEKVGIILKDATDEEIMETMKYFNLGGIAELYKQLRVYENKN